MMKHVLIAAVLLLAATGFSAGDAPDDLAVLKSYFSTETSDRAAPPEQEIARVAFDLGESAIPVLVAGLNHPDEEKAGFAAERLACIGGTNAVVALRAAYEKKPSVWLKTQLCFSLASTGSKADIDFLIQSLQGEHVGDEWAPIQAAGFSLGILRTERAKDASRAVCSVSLYFGPLNASGYDYLLRKKDGKWTVIGMKMTWVS